MLLEEDRDQCCQLCKAYGVLSTPGLTLESYMFSGCLWEGKERASGSEWVDKEDPCRVFKCLAGVVTETKMICHVPCESPLPPRPGECCPTCRGTRLLLPPRNRCFLVQELRLEGEHEELSSGNCTKCTCMKNGMVHCVRERCPVLECPMERRVWPIEVDVRVLTLIYPNICPRQEGERWALDPCRSCVCTSGSVRCAMEMCPPMNAKGLQRAPLSSPNTACPPNTRLYHPEGTCCPACVESKRALSFAQI
ncbi:hypothetical protein J437_LFUL016491 [Ladona fulva]|uniref:VWFC domain-containing protein n=1 Tax=Ladona fulva TaxID=123851 RepID=A0A8K0P8U0_LADFU|nr:hypothetical protein J437_LFUL016491 [Ladona fulva]